jgi:bifunctional non-homologous end joining protein LigD
MGTSTKVQVGNVEVAISNLDKVFYPKTGFTKGQVIDYYIRISEVLLPHLQDRPITLKRYPNGVEGLFFYEKQCPSSRPKWVKTTKVPKSDGSDINYCVMNDLPALIWAANLADLELHTFLHKMPRIHCPTALAFDLDPGPPADVVACCEVAVKLRKIFAAMDMESFPKTSGSKGMQVYVPLNTAVTYDQTKGLARELASSLERQFPHLVVSKMDKALRKGKVFVDWSQNSDTKTTINVYSLRAMERPMVSAPVKWEEVEHALETRNAREIAFDTGDVLKRVEKLGDIFFPVLNLKQKLPAKYSFS